MFKPQQQIKFLSWITCLLAIILIGFCLRAAYTTFLFPIYPDEIAERILLSRFGYDFPNKFDLMPMCHATISAFPKLWYLPGFLDWLLHGHIFNLKIFRLIGVLISWGFFLLLSIQLVYKNSIFSEAGYTKYLSSIILFGLVLAFLNIGVVPFSLVTNRPEAIILFWLTLAIILFKVPVKTHAQKLSLTALFFICVAMLFYAHPKTILLAPVLFIIAHRIFSHFKSTYVYTGLWILFSLVVLDNYYLWTSTFTLCKDSTVVNNVFAGFNVDIHLLLNQPNQFFTEIYTNFLNYQVDIDRISFQSTPEANYLPDLIITRNIELFNQWLGWNYLIGFFLLLSATSISYFRDVLKNKFVTLNLLSLTLIICAIFNLLINNTKHWYDASYLWCLLAVAALVYLSGQIRYLLQLRITYLAILYFLIMAMTSLNILMTQYEPPLLNGFSGPGISLAVYDHKKINNDLKTLARLCEIDVKHSKNLVLDDLTYHYFQTSKYPLAFSYLFYANDVKFLHRFLDKFAIDGLITRYSTLPEKSRAKYTTQIGDLVCVPKKNIKAFFKEMIP